jgi:hypothetical protein
MGKRENGNVKGGRGDEPEGKHSKGAKTAKEKLVAKAAGGKTQKRKGIKYI